MSASKQELNPDLLTPEHRSCKILGDQKLEAKIANSLGTKQIKVSRAKYLWGFGCFF